MNCMNYAHNKHFGLFKYQSGCRNKEAVTHSAVLILIHINKLKQNVFNKILTRVVVHCIKIISQSQIISNFPEKNNALHPYLNY